jgi:hypothetical protein
MGDFFCRSTGLQRFAGAGHDGASRIGTHGDAKLDQILAFLVQGAGVTAGLTQLFKIFENLGEFAGKIFVNFG